MINRTGFRLAGQFIAECHDKLGNLIWVEKTHNLITTEGLNRILDVFLHGTTQTATWYCGLVNTNTVPDAGMTYDVPVFTESVAYDEADRPIYVEAASVAGSVTNSANKAVFTMSGTETIYGAFLTSVITKGNHAAGADNVLYCYARFAAGKPVVDDYVISLTYTVTAADDGV
jgi:hypothetical protein